MERTVIAYELSQFTYDRTSRAFVACASDLGLTAAASHQLGTSDIKIVNIETRGERTFVLTHTDIIDGDLRSWSYRSTSAEADNRRLTLTIFND